MRATKSHQWENKVHSVRSGVREASLERNGVASTLLVQFTVDKATHFKRHNKRVFFLNSKAAHGIPGLCDSVSEGRPKKIILIQTQITSSRDKP